MLFIVDFYGKKSRKLTSYPHVRLVQDNWDDYGYKTTFLATIHLAEDDSVQLGGLKILEEKQTSGYTPLPEEPFERLGASFCSMSGNLDYYETLFKLGRSVYKDYLRGLRDVAYDDEVRAHFEDLEGYKVSLLRFSGAERTIVDASKLFSRVKSHSRKSGTGFAFKFKTQVALDANTFTINFDFRRKEALPHRINAIIGYNGTGKTRLLSNLAIVASGYGYSNKEDAVAKTAGRFVETQPPFKKVVVVSYSAFDTFVIPGQTRDEKTRLQTEGDLFGYAYCGLRERVEDVNEGYNRRRPTYRLKTPEEIESEFLSALKRIGRIERSDVLLSILRPLLSDASFRRVGLTQLFAENDDDSRLDLFRSLSSGHKIVLKIVTELTCHLDGLKPTLVLIDEPETHLHPPLLAALLRSVRHCLELLEGYAVIATHSPVVLQEMPARYVSVLKRIVNRTQVTPASIETFGESIGVITQDIFNLDDGSTDWHETLRELSKGKSLEEIEKLFGRNLGFSARSYVVSAQDEES